MKSAHKAEKAKAFPVFFVGLAKTTSKNTPKIRRFRRVRIILTCLPCPLFHLYKNPRGKEEKQYAV